MRQKDTVPASIEFAKIQNQRNVLAIQKNNLGLFKVKEKKVLQDQIDALDGQMAEIKKQVDEQQEQIQRQINPLVEQKKDISKQREAVLKEIDISV